MGNPQADCRSTTPETIPDLEQTLKKNAEKFYSSLSDGLRGHLSLVLSPTEYALLSNAPFIIPQMPPPHVIFAQTTAVQAANLKDVYDRELGDLCSTSHPSSINQSD